MKILELMKILNKRSFVWWRMCWKTTNAIKFCVDNCYSIVLKTDREVYNAMLVAYQYITDNKDNVIVKIDKSERCLEVFDISNNVIESRPIYVIKFFNSSSVLYVKNENLVIDEIWFYDVSEIKKIVNNNNNNIMWYTWTLPLISIKQMKWPILDVNDIENIKLSMWDREFKEQILCKFD